MCTDLVAPLAAFNKLNGSLYSKAIGLPLPWRAQQQRKPELAVCVDEPKEIREQESGAGSGCPREELSPSTVATHVWPFGVPIPVTRGSLAGPGQRPPAQHRCPLALPLQVPPRGRAGCAR